MGGVGPEEAEVWNAHGGLQSGGTPACGSLTKLRLEFAGLYGRRQVDMWLNMGA